jgi:hypothetical protein
MQPVGYHDVGADPFCTVRPVRRRFRPVAYYIDAAKVAAFDAALARRSGKIKDYPNPYLASEVDISRPKIDRQGIDAALQVSEVWRVFDEHVSIERLQSDGKYVVAVSSKLLRVTPDDVERWVLREGARGSVTWKQRLREWVRNEVVPRTAM